MLIGSDYYFAWVLSGPTSAEELREKFATVKLIIERMELMTLSPFDTHSENDELYNVLQKFWDIESLGVREKPAVSQSDGGEFLDTIHFGENERRFKVGLPWKEGLVPASNKYKLCYKIETAALVTEEKQGTVEGL